MPYLATYLKWLSMGNTKLHYISHSFLTWSCVFPEHVPVWPLLSACLSLCAACIVTTCHFIRRTATDLHDLSFNILLLWSCSFYLLTHLARYQVSYCLKKMRMLGCWSSFLRFLSNLNSSITLPYFLCAQLTDEKVLKTMTKHNDARWIQNKSIKCTIRRGESHTHVFLNKRNLIENK